jgi:putative FmdB family regulatory protein
MNDCGAKSKLSAPLIYLSKTGNYRCKKCGKRFDLAMTISEHDTKQVQCPHCKSTEVEPQLQAFFAKTSKKS